MPQLLVILAVLVIGLVALATAFVIGWRRKSRLVLGPIVWLSKQFMNPVQMRSAGGPGAYASIVRHRGRISGAEYETPVGVVADRGAFLIALPYGSRAQWLRNVLAAGSATLVHEGSTYRVDRPELIALATVADRFPASDQGLFRWLRVEDCLRLRDAEREGRSTHPGPRSVDPQVAISRPALVEHPSSHSRAAS